MVYTEPGEKGGEGMSDTVKHSPGPWRWIDRDGSDLGTIVSGQDVVCHFGNNEQFYPSEGQEPSYHDRLLFCAAPDMLEALKDALKVADSGESDIRGINWKQIEAAIAKADGT